MTSDPDGDGFEHSLHVRAMGVTVEIAVPDQQTRDRLAHQWSRAVVEAPDEPAQARTTARPAPGDTEAFRDYMVTTQVTMEALRATAGRRINLHAGGVADERRRVLAVVGPSGTGKTTATLALARRLGYVSDETVSIDPDGTVAPHPKPLSVIIDPQRPRREGASCRRTISGSSRPPTRDGSPAWSSCSVEPRARRVWPGSTPREGMLQLIEQSSSLAELPRPLHAMVELIEGCGGLWALTYEEIDDHVDELVGLLADPPAAPAGELRADAGLARGPRATFRLAIGRGRSTPRPTARGPRPWRSTTSSSCSARRAPCCSPT